METLKELMIELESCLKIKEVYESSIEPENYSLRISKLKIDICELKIKMVEAINKI